MYFSIYEDGFIKIEVTKDDINYLLKNQSLAEFDTKNKIRIELINEEEE